MRRLAPSPPGEGSRKVGLNLLWASPFLLQQEKPLFKKHYGIGHPIQPGLLERFFFCCSTRYTM